MHQLKVMDQKKLVDCLAYSTDDPLIVLRFVEKFKEFYAPIYTGSPFYNIEVHANAKLDAEAELAYFDDQHKEEIEQQMIMQSKDRRVS